MYIFLLYTFLKSTHEKKCHQDKSFKITIIKNRKHCEMSKAWKAFPAVRGNVFMSVSFCLRLRPFIRWLPPATPGTEGKYQVYYFLQHFSFTNKRHSITRTVHLTVHQPSSHITHTLIQHNTKVACRADMGKLWFAGHYSCGLWPSLLLQSGVQHMVVAEFIRLLKDS